MIFLRVLASLLAVVKIILGVLFVIVADCDASHAFGAGGYQPPDWQPAHVFLALAGIGLAYPHSLFRSRTLLSLIFIALPAVAMIATISDLKTGTSFWCLIAFLLSIGEWLLQRYAFAERTTPPPPGLNDLRIPAAQKPQQEKKQTGERHQ